MWNRHNTIPRRILVVRTDRMGDVLLSTPVLSALRQRYPDAHIAMLVSPYTREVVEAHPALDLVIEDDKDRINSRFIGFMRLVRTIKSQGFDAMLVLHPTFRVALLGVLAGISIRVGSGYRAYSSLFNRRIYEHRWDANRHEVEYNLAIAAALDVSTIPQAPHITITDAARKQIDCIWNQWNLKPDEALIVLHPGSGGSARDWPLESFAELGDRLSKDGMKIVITGGPGEKDLVEDVVRRMHIPPLKLVGETSIKELAALLSRSVLCISNSTGPLHLAAATGTPTVAMFCPIKPCSPIRWGPFGSGHRVLKPEVPDCPGCIKEACPYWDCMTRIRVDEAHQAVLDVLETSKLGR